MGGERRKGYLAAPASHTPGKRGIQWETRSGESSPPTSDVAVLSTGKSPQGANQKDTIASSSMPLPLVPRCVRRAARVLVAQHSLYDAGGVRCADGILTPSLRSLAAAPFSSPQEHVTSARRRLPVGNCVYVFSKKWESHQAALALPHGSQLREAP